MAELRMAEWQKLLTRFKAVGLTPPDKRNFEGTSPTTMEGWQCLRALLEKEGKLSDAAILEIEEGLDKLRIREKEAEIWRRITLGASLPDPSLPETSPPISAEYLRPGTASSIVKWNAIQELGLNEKWPDDSVRQQASLESYRIKSKRGDFNNLIKTMRPPGHISPPEIQTPNVPADFVDAEITIPLVALKVPSGSLEFIRYHLDCGLIWGTTEKVSYYDRGAGGSPGSRGRTVTRYYPVVRSLLEAINLRKVRLFRPMGQFLTCGDPAIVVGRKRLPLSYSSAVLEGKSFWSREEARGVFTGEFASAFITQSLTVEVTTTKFELILRFKARIGRSKKETPQSKP